MEKHEDVTSILSKLNLDQIEETIKQPYHQTGAGKPPRNPLSIFKALMIKQLRHIPSDRELYRRLWNDETLREICDIEEKEKPYHPSQLTRFRNKVGPARLTKIMNSLIRELVEGDIIKGKTLALDATFIKAWSRRDPTDDSHGYSDPESHVGRDGKTYDLGYKVHLAVDTDSDMPVAALVATVLSITLAQPADWRGIAVSIFLVTLVYSAFGNLVGSIFPRPMEGTLLVLVVSFIDLMLISNPMDLIR